jgi:large subunit ribosomal protein L5
VDNAVNEMTTITGQKAVATIASKSISNFKLERIYADWCKSDSSEIEKCTNFWIGLYRGFPRVRDFKGINDKSFDGRGNYSLGIKEQIIFPEIDIDKVRITGMDITFVTSAKTDAEAYALLKAWDYHLKIKKINSNGKKIHNCKRS